MFGLKKKVELNNEEKKTALTSVMQKAKTGDTSELRTLIADALGRPEIGSDSKLVTDIIRDLTFHGLPPEKKNQGLDFSTWWSDASPEERAAALDNAMAWMFSR